MSEKLTMLSLELTRATDNAAVCEVTATEDGSQEDVVNATSYLAVDSGRSPSTLLLDLEGRRVWIAGLSSGGLLPLAPGQTQTAHLLFGAVDLDQVTAMIPQCGFITLAVMDREAAMAAGMDEAAIASVEAEVAQKGDPGDAIAPVPMETYTRTLNDSTGTHTSDKEITLTPTGGTAQGQGTATPPAPADLPAAKGASGQGPQGVTATSDEGRVSVTLSHVARTGGVLLGRSPSPRDPAAPAPAPH